MRNFILALTLILTPASPLAFISPVAQAQSTAAMNQDLRNIGAWSQELNRFNIEVGAIFDSPEFNALLAYVDIGDFTSEGFQSAYIDWQVDYKSRISKLREFEAGIAPTPEVQTKDLRPIVSALAIQRETFPQTVNDIQELCVRLDNILARSARGDLDGLDELTEILIERTITVIELENTSLEQIRATIKDSDHPNYYVLGMMVGANNFAVETLRITSFAETRKEREPYLRAMRVIVSQARQDEKDARAALARNRAQAQRMVGLGGPDEKRLINTLVKLWDEFEVAIDTESEMIGYFEQQLALYESDRTTTDVDPEIMALDEKVYDLINYRLQLADQRARLVGQLQ